MELNTDQQLNDFLSGRSALALQLFDEFVNEFQTVGPITLHPAKSMIGISNGNKRVAWVTQFGKSFIHVIFPFRQPYEDNLCFQKIAQVPGDAHQFNHHFRMLSAADVNDEVRGYMLMAFKEEE